MPNPKIYTNELARFRNKYNMPEYDLNALAGVDQKFQHLNNFLFESSTTANPAAQFVNWASRTLGMYFEANTSLRADGKYMSIAAASILAKTHRDEYMCRLHDEYPQYDWKGNKGYPTKKHRAAIEQYGTTPYHRLTFRLLDTQQTLNFDYE